MRYTSGGIAGAVLVAGGWWQWGHRPVRIMTPSGLGSGADQVMAALSGAGAVGQWVIHAYPEYDRPANQLAQSLRDRLRLPASGPVAQEQLTDRMQKKIQQDFATGDLLTVQKWQLSSTEALIAVLRFKIAGNSTVVVPREALEQHIADVTNWGPRTTAAGVLPNSFGEGFASLWFTAADAPRWAQIAIDNQRLRTKYRENRVLIASFRGKRKFQEKLFGKPGEYPITLHDDMTHRWQKIGVFVVTEALADSGLQASNNC